MRKKIILDSNLRRELEEYQEKIHLICRRFNRAVDELDILRWLKNFEPTKWEDALTVLSMVEYIDDSEILEAYNYCLQVILPDIPKKVYIDELIKRRIKKRRKSTKIIVVPVGMPGKSGTAMVYFLRKTQIFDKNKHRFEIVVDVEKLSEYKGKEYFFVFVDDYFGSGGSAAKYYKNYIQDKIGVDTPSYWISVVVQENAVNQLEKKISNCKVIYWKKHYKAFLKNRSPFGKYERVRELREFCYAYGQRINWNEPLGYENTQGMVTFSYGAPNNLLPIFWSSGKKWFPIFPRYSKDRMSWSKDFRKEVAYWLSLVRVLDTEVYSKIATGQGTRKNGTEEFNYILKIDFQIFCIIRMLKQRRAIPVICQILGIALKDYEDLMEEGRKRKIFDQNKNLTQFGELMYNEILGKVIEYRLREVRSTINAPTVLYVPRSFRGET
ncbi:hypothetical protein MU858_28360 (plasmid) [Bacillus sp. PGP15]|uniref:phosphoribosyltransferase-like protein n=1 Tax=Bacillus TaxID=1386 RepID=UPI002001C133|nr:hypothetical protein [Bacillus sp. PGP15]UPL47371.1 hypothetical protein MU858_28360 [Bacillus sp. PGP15]